MKNTLLIAARYLSLPALLGLATTTAFAGDGPPTFPVQVSFTVFADACDPYAAGSGCADFSALTGTLSVTGELGGQSNTVTAFLDVEGEAADDKHKGGKDTLLLPLSPGGSLSFTFAGSYQSIGDPQPAAHPLFAFAPGVVIGPAQGVPQSAPSVVLGTLKSGQFDAFTLSGSIYAFNGTQQVGSWSATLAPSVPEPGRLALSGVGIALLALARRRSTLSSR